MAEYNAGSTKRVNSVDEIIPPITTVASGRCTSAPVPVFKAIGKKPRLATRAVIMIGRRRISAPSMIAPVNLLASLPRCLQRSLIKASITKPFSTATPDSAIKPTPADIDKGISRSHRAITPPVSARGTPVKMIMASLKEPKAMINKPRMIASVIGTTTDRRLLADSSCWKVPP